MKYVIDDTPIIEADVLVRENPIISPEVLVPLISIKDKGLIYRGIVADEGALMINGKAPFGSSEDDGVWTVFINPIDGGGNVVEEEIEVLENQIWSEIEQMYN